MKRHLKIISAVISFFMITSTFYGCKKQPDKQLIKVRLNEVVRSIFYAPMYVAINQGFFKEQGIEIELSTGQGADKTMQQVISGNADIGFCGPEQVIYLYNQGREDYTIIFGQLTRRDGSYLVGRKPEPDFKWEDLRGKTIIGGRPGGVPEMTLEYILKSHGLTPGKDVNIITNLAFTATQSAFQAGTADYVASFEPTASMLVKQNAGHIVSSIGLESGEVPYTAFFAKKSYIEKNPEIIQKFTNAIYKGMLWVYSHTSKEVAEAVISFFPGSDVEMLSSIVDRYKKEGHWGKDLILKEEQISRLMDIIQSYQADLIPKRPPYKDIVTTKYAEEAINQVKK
ncbi:ABC transporter substrate-binding protein [Fonticella tunisiensis]|uniref:NitT/TauT family transport system substrate-binding protein n=1 Tax=Fonticella tunisiensis TaxID=1096341 RepID=A0A4R7KQU2_9CLOT|nr:ABC transporter substrate-binding protein [Fonticella tunisiensis]TDT61086.1 NitT/TauT family transport system substrate-binding protein [Fonticella tunisiensis]